MAILENSVAVKFTAFKCLKGNDMINKVSEFTNLHGQAVTPDTFALKKKFLTKRVIKEAFRVSDGEDSSTKSDHRDSPPHATDASEIKSANKRTYIQLL